MNIKKNMKIKWSAMLLNVFIFWLYSLPKTAKLNIIEILKCRQGVLDHSEISQRYRRRKKRGNLTDKR